MLDGGDNLKVARVRRVSGLCVRVEGKKEEERLGEVVQGTAEDKGRVCA